MSNFKETCQEFYGTTDLYEILGVEKTATEKQIKKAYHKLSLLVHPDRVGDSEKSTATEKFKVLGKIHSILQDKDKRKIYDECGDIDDETMNDSSFNWMDYWRAIFKKIEIKDIENYEKEYIGSETELRDIKKAYVGTKGNMDAMLELIPFSNCDNEPRIQGIVRKMIDDKEVEEYPGFFNESVAKKRRRRAKWDEEKREAEQIDASTLEKEITKRQEQRLQGFASFLDDIEAKYGGGGGGREKRKSITNGKGGGAPSAKRAKTSAGAGGKKRAAGPKTRKSSAK